MPWQEKKKGSVGSDSHHFVAIVVWSIRNNIRKAARRQNFHVSLSDTAVPLKTVPRRHKSSVHTPRSILTGDGYALYLQLMVSSLQDPGQHHTQSCHFALNTQKTNKQTTCHKFETEWGPEHSCAINTLWWSLSTLYLQACQVRVTVDDSGLCYCTCVMYFEHNVVPNSSDNNNKLLWIWHAKPFFFSRHGKYLKKIIRARNT